MAYISTITSNNIPINSTHIPNQNTYSPKDIEDKHNQNIILDISSKAKNIIELKQINHQLNSVFGSNKKLNEMEKIDLDEAEHKIYEILDKYRDPKEKKEISEGFMEYSKFIRKATIAPSDEELFEQLKNWHKVSDEDKLKHANKETKYTNKLKEMWETFLGLSSISYISSSDRAMSYNVSKEIDKVLSSNNNISSEYKEKLLKLQEEANSRYQHGDYKEVNMPELVKVELNTLFDNISQIYDLPKIDSKYLAKASELVFKGNQISKEENIKAFSHNLIADNSFGNEEKETFTDKELLTELMNWDKLIKKSSNPNDINYTKEVWNKFLDLSSIYNHSSSDKIVSYGDSKEIHETIKNSNMLPIYKEELLKGTSINSK